MSKFSDNISFIKRDETNIIKGIALILMFYHHFFTIPDYWIDSVSVLYSADIAEMFSASFKICVPIFAFLTGYFYFFSKKTYRYSIRKISDLYINYIVVFLLLMFAAILLNVYKFSIVMFLAEATALVRPNMYHCWYVLFYAIAMLLMPIYAKISQKSDMLAFSIFAVIPLFLNSIIGMLDLKISSTLSDIFDYFLWLPCISSGFCFAKYNIFEKLSMAVKTKYKSLNVLIYISFIIIPFIAMYYGGFSFICAPLFVFGILSIVKLIRYKRIFAPISVIGKYSVLMWFLHCIFANPCKYFTQPILYYPKNQVLVLIWGLVMCLAVAFVIKFPIDFVIKLKNRIFKL